MLEIPIGFAKKFLNAILYLDAIGQINYYRIRATDTAAQSTGFGGHMENTLTKFFNPIYNQVHDIAHYEVIENEVIDARVLNKLSISGSLFSLTTFNGVTFESCVFYGSIFKNCTFSGCKFLNCRFEFGEILECDFRGTTFENCFWDFTTLESNILNLCNIDGKTSFYLHKEENQLYGCVLSGPLSWEEVFTTQEEVLPPLPEENVFSLTEYLEEKTRTLLHIFNLAS